jgi:hypothetical protein
MPSDAAVDTTTNTVTRKATGKRAREPEEVIPESNPAPAKKTKALTNRPSTSPQIRRSARSPRPTAKAIAKKRKRTTAEVQAAKAAAEEAKKKKAEDEQEAHRHLARMDIDDDRERVQIATRAIRRLSDMASEDEGEEFVGFNDTFSSSSDEAVGVENLRVSCVILAIESFNTHYDCLQEAYEKLQQEMRALQEQINGDGGKKTRTEGGKKKYVVICT